MPREPPVTRATLPSSDRVTSDGMAKHNLAHSRTAVSSAGLNSRRVKAAVTMDKAAARLHPTMNIEAIRKHCLGFPHTTENVQWGCDLCFKVDGKLFAVTPLEPAPVQLSFKCTPEMFAELCERPG